MSLNKFTDATSRKEYMKINCKEIKCETLEVDDTPWGELVSSGSVPASWQPAVGFNPSSLGPVYYRIIGDYIYLSTTLIGINTQQEVIFTLNFPSIGGKRLNANDDVVCLGNGASIATTVGYRLENVNIPLNDTISFNLNFVPVGIAAHQVNLMFVAKYRA